jgi:hypothetical protein
MLRTQDVKTTRSRTDLPSYTATESRSILLSEILDDNAVNTDELLLDLFEPLYSSDTFIEILESLNEDWMIRLEHLNDGGYAIDIDNATLWIDNSGLLPDALARSVYFRQSIRHNIIRAVREAWHIENFQDDYDSFAPESLLKCERIRSADVESMAILCVYEMHLSDEESRLWQHLLGNDTGDMAICFSRFLERGPFTHNKLELALQQAFKQWYNDRARVDACDHRTLEEMDNILSWDKSAMSDRKATLRPTKIAQMTARPEGKGSYIGDLNIRLMRHPAYSVMNDPVNQVHLSHIMRDIEAVVKGDVYFRCAKLADKMFPEDATFAIENETLASEDMVIR